MKGIITSLTGGLYTVKSEGKYYACSARGNFRHKNISPLVGDFVDIKVIDEEKKSGVIDEIFERKNFMNRPSVANIDNAILVSSVSDPYLNDFIIDKMLLLIEYKGIEPILIFTKMDLVNDSIEKEVKEKILTYRNSGYTVIESSLNKDVKKDILNLLDKNSTSVITGQTGVGKTTLINSIKPILELKTGEISKALGRGKHTTRHVEMFEIDDDKFVIDTPGFSSFESEGITLSEVNYVFKDFKKSLNKCKFNNCMHIMEPGCHIKKLVEDGDISKKRYNNYLRIIGEMKENEK